MKSFHLAQPRAIMMVGTPGSGKSFFAGQFSSTFNIPYIDSDEVNKLSASKLAGSHLIVSFLTEVSKTKQTYIFEGSSETKQLRNDFAKFASSKGYLPLIVWVQTDKITSSRRALKNGHSKEYYDKIITQFESPEINEKPVVISGRHTYASQARIVLKQIAKDNRPNKNTQIRDTTKHVIPKRVS